MASAASYYRDLVEKETRRLVNTCQHWESVSLGPNINEEAQGYIRSAVGQANLLIKERFAQFVGLIHVCENNLGEKKTTCEDLQGFWDMIYFQVEDVNRKFGQLIKLQENAWHVEQPNEATRTEGLAFRGDSGYEGCCSGGLWKISTYWCSLNPRRGSGKFAIKEGVHYVEEMRLSVHAKDKFSEAADN